MNLKKRLSWPLLGRLDPLYLLSVFAILLVAGIWYAVLTRLAVENDIRMQGVASGADKLTHAFAEHTVRTLREIDQIAKLLKYEYEGSAGAIYLPELRAKALARTDSVSRISITNSKGELVTGRSAVQLANVADREYFYIHATKDEDRLFIGKPVLELGTKQWTVPMTRRLNHSDGSFAGVILISMDPSYLTSFYDDADLAEHGLLSVLGKDGIFRAWRTGAQIQIGTAVARQEFLEYMQASQGRAKVVASSVDGRRRLMGFRELPDYPLIVSAGISEEALLTAYEAARNRYYMRAIVASVLIIGVFLFIGTLVRRLRSGQRQAQAAQETYRAATEGSLDAFYILECHHESDGRISDFVVTDLNERGTKLIGRPRAAVIGCKMTELIAPTRNSGFFEGCVRVVESHQPLEAELQMMGAKGKTRWVHYQVVPVGDGVAVTARDITERKRNEEKMRSNRAFLETMIDHVPIAIYAKSMRSQDFGQYVLWNKSSEAIFGITTEDAMGKTVHDLFAQPAAERATQQDASVIASAMVETIAEEPFESQGSTRFLHTIKAPLFDNEDNVEYVLCISEDITDRKQAADNLRLASTVFDHAAESILVSDANDCIILVNPAFRSLTDFEPVDVIGYEAVRFEVPETGTTSPVEVVQQVAEHGFWSGESRLRRKDGVTLPCWLNISCVRDGNGQIVNYVRILSDFSSFKESQQKLEHLANYDSLTSLPNRHLFQDRLGIALERCKRAKRKLALLFIDLDNFKNINDSIGHQTGDLLLKEVAQRLHQCVRGEDTVCRLGGDEFTIIIEDMTGPDDAAVVSQRAMQALGQPFHLVGHSVSTSASIGISVYPDDGQDSATLIKNADLAMYKAKELGKSGYQFFSRQLGDRVARRLLLEQSLRGAIERNELSLVYQPKIRLIDGSVAGLEALLRWQNPERGNIPPLEFIPVAESTGLIVPIGEWVIDSACAQIKDWRESGLGELSVAVNVSAQQFKRGDLVGAVALALAANAVDAHLLELEITESAVMEDPEAAQRTLKQLKELGVLISVDDFGTGYSSLASLKRFAVDTLKIDKSFTRDVATDSETAAITKAIVTMAHSLRMTVVAEGVELIAQLEFLKVILCDQAQGYLFSKAVAPNEVAALLASLPGLAATKYSMAKSPSRLTDRSTAGSGHKHK